MPRKPKSKDRGITAAELQAELAADAGYVARERRKAAESRKRAAAELESAQPVVSALRVAGLDVGRIGDVSRLPDEAYRAAVPVLVRWLPLLEDVAVKQVIVRSLAVPLASPEAVPALIIEFTRFPPTEQEAYRWVVGDALAETLDETASAVALDLATDPRWGKAREMLIVGLGRLPADQVTEPLLALLHDKAVAGHALIALGKLRDPTLRSAIEPFLQHDTAWVRREAARALRRITP